MVHLTEASGFGMDRLGGRREIPIRRVTATMGAMLSLSFGLLLVTGLLGGGLAMTHLRAGTRPVPTWPLGGLHALLGIIGLAALMLSLRGPPRGEAMGVAGFGRIAGSCFRSH
jgi:hypothetical protein